MDRLNLHLRSQKLSSIPNGYNHWESSFTEKSVLPSQTCLILCDVWDRHWSRGAAERLEIMLPAMTRVVKTARARGIRIIHAPSETMGFYANTPARERMLQTPAAAPPRSHRRPNPPLPIQDSDGGSDTGETTDTPVWTRQHPAIEIDQLRDGISDNGLEIYNFICHMRIEQILILGVHTNMCILHRSFAIKQMVRWGLPIALVRDMTDTMYNPAMPPYVSHAEGTCLVVEFIEKFWCPTILSEDLLD
jgi:nicotinamidase-related amidase